MKILMIILTILINSVCFAWDYYDYEGKLNLVAEDELITKDFTQKGQYLLYEQEFYPVDYALNRFRYNSGCEDTIMGFYASYSVNRKNKAEFHVIITMFEEPRFQVKSNIEPDYDTVDYKFVNTAQEEENLSTYFDAPNPYYESGNLICIKKIQVWVYVGYIDPAFESVTCKVLHLWIDNLVIGNPEYENLCEASLKLDREYKITDDLNVVIDNFYYGYDIGSIDLYIVFYNGTNLFFHPYMTTVIDATNVQIPQYTMMQRMELNVGTFNLSKVNPVIGENYMTIGIAEEGTLNFLNEIYIRSFQVKE